jgi:hypothetical protein
LHHRACAFPIPFPSFLGFRQVPFYTKTLFSLTLISIHTASAGISSLPNSLLLQEEVSHTAYCRRLGSQLTLSDLLTPKQLTAARGGVSHGILPETRFTTYVVGSPHSQTAYCCKRRCLTRHTAGDSIHNLRCRISSHSNSLLLQEEASHTAYCRRLGSQLTLSYPLLHSHSFRWRESLKKHWPGLFVTHTHLRNTIIWPEGSAQRCLFSGHL